MSLITKTTVNLVKNKVPNSNLLAYATIEVAGLVELHGFKVLEGNNGLYIGEPSKLKMDKDGNPIKWTDANGVEKSQYEKIVRSTSDNSANVIKTAILNAYAAVKAGANAKAASES